MCPKLYLVHKTFVENTNNSHSCLKHAILYYIKIFKS